MIDNNYVLAMYDIRGKQEYIYKSNKMKEIIGASGIIRDCFRDYLYPAAELCSEKGIFCYTEMTNHADFSRETFVAHVGNGEEGGYIGEVIYDGGGNFFVLYRDMKAYQEVNRIFYRMLMESTYSLRVLTSYVEGVDFDNYKDDQRRLYEVHRTREQKETMMNPVNALPIVQVDYRTFMPLSEMQNVGGMQRKVTYESKQKYKKYESERDKVEGERILDRIVTQRGKESLLAVIYIDGNNMGAQVENCLNGTDASYESSVNALRRFSAEIQEYYIDKRIEDVDALLKGKEKQNRRFAVHAGDEITFICNARYAYEVALEYLKKLATDNMGEALRTSCAGIAIFHSHMPFSEAYRIAEECCESGKKLMKKEGIANASLIDFHYCQGAIGTSLDDIRKQEENEDLSRPWFVMLDKTEKASKELVNRKYVSDEIVKDMMEQLNLAGRGNIKNLLFGAKKSEADFLMELERIKAHQKKEKGKIDFSLGGKLDEAMQRKLIYDMVIVYDLWFAEEKEGEDE